MEPSSLRSAPHYRGLLAWILACVVLAAVSQARAQEPESRQDAAQPPATLAPASAETAGDDATLAQPSPAAASSAGDAHRPAPAQPLPPPERATVAAPPLSANAPAPCEPCRRRRDANTEGYGAFLIGGGFFDLSSLNDRLEQNGYETIDGPLTLLGGEGHAVLQSGFVVGGRGAAVIGPTGAGPGDLQTHFAGGFGLFDMGFALVHTRSVLLTALGGVGGYGMSLSIGDDLSARFDDVLDNPRRSTSVSRGGLLVGLTLGIDGRVPIGDVDDEGRRGFFTLGARVGGLYGLALGGWSLPEDANATRGPELGLTGAYAMLAIGFGGGPAETK